MKLKCNCETRCPEHTSLDVTVGRSKENVLLKISNMSSVVTFFISKEDSSRLKDFLENYLNEIQ